MSYTLPSGPAGSCKNRARNDPAVYAPAEAGSTWNRFLRGVFEILETNIIGLIYLDPPGQAVR